MEKETRDKEKVERVLGIYTKLLDGITVNKQKESRKYGVVNRSIQRDIDNIRSYLAKTDNEESVYNNVLYDYKRKGYYLEHIYFKNTIKILIIPLKTQVSIKIFKETNTSIYYLFTTNE